MDYQPNSHRFKEEQKKAAIEERKKVEKVITGTATTKTKGKFDKLFETFVHEDAPKIKAFLARDIFMPAFKRGLMGIIDMLIPGGGASGGQSYDSSGPKIRYSKFAEEPNYRKATGTVQARDRFEYDDIAFPSYGAAERVLSTMKDIFAEYRSVTLAEMYELAGLEHPYTFTKYGWESLQGAEVIRRGEDYFIKLPPASLITH